MRGSIRALVGFLVVFGAVGGIETGSASLFAGTVTALVGLAIMASGTAAIRQSQM